MRTRPANRAFWSRRGATLVDSVAMAACAALIAAVVAVSLSDARRAAQLTRSLANLQVYAEGTRSYAGDYANAVWSFTWRGGQTQNTPYPDLNIAWANDADAGRAQAVYIIRRLGPTTTFNTGTWTPHIRYSHLVLADHLGLALPAEFAVSPADTVRRSWLPYAPNPCGQGPTPPNCGAFSERIVYTPSYELPPAFFSPDAGTTMSQGATHSQYEGPSTVPLGRRRLDEVAFPSQKVMVHEVASRYFGRAQYWAYDAARVPLMLVDGSADVRRTGSANRGFFSTSPTAVLYPRFSYAPSQADEPPTLSGAPSDTVTGYYRWTRSGLKGRDFGGAEVPWVP